MADVADVASLSTSWEAAYRSGPSHIAGISLRPLPLPGHHGDSKGEEKREVLSGIFQQLPLSFHLSWSCNSLCSCSLHPQKTSGRGKRLAGLWGLQPRLMDAVEEEEAGCASRLPTRAATEKIMR